MNKIIAILVLAFSFSFADDFDMDGRMIPTFTIPKADTNFNLSREVEIKKVTLNDSTLTTREKVALVNPSFKITSHNVLTGEVKNMEME